MYRRSYDSGHTDSHECEFVEPSSEYFEDGAFIVIYRCHHAPVIDRAVDTARDEVYTETGPRCETRKHVRLDLSRLEIRQRGQWQTVEESDGNVAHEQYEDDTAISGLIGELECAIDTALTKHVPDHAMLQPKYLDGSGVSMDAALNERVFTVCGEERSEYFEEKYRLTYNNVTTDIVH